MISGMSKNHNLHSDQSLQMESVPERKQNRKKAHQVFLFKAQKYELEQVTVGFYFSSDCKQLLDEVFVISRIIKTKAFFTH